MLVLFFYEKDGELKRIRKLTFFVQDGKKGFSKGASILCFF